MTCNTDSYGSSRNLGLVDKRLRDKPRGCLRDKAGKKQDARFKLFVKKVHNKPCQIVT